MVYYIFAMPREAENVDIDNKVVVGINAVDLPTTTEDDVIVNIGYCGAYDVPIGTIVEPSKVYDVDTGDSVSIDRIFGCEDIKCFTSSEFVTEPVVNHKSIYDMELYKLSKLPHRKIYSLKIVSDNLNEEACEQYNDAAVWLKIKEILEKFKHEIV